MQKIRKLLLMLAVALTFGVYSSSAQIIVKVRPARPHYERVVAPTPRHVWVDEDWEPRRGAYVFIGGRWVEPPRPGVVWVPGHWARRRHGEVWVPGHWR